MRLFRLRTTGAFVFGLKRWWIGESDTFDLIENEAGSPLARRTFASEASSLWAMLICVVKSCWAATSFECIKYKVNKNMYRKAPAHRGPYFQPAHWLSGTQDLSKKAKLNFSLQPPQSTSLRLPLQDEIESHWFLQLNPLGKRTNGEWSIVSEDFQPQKPGLAITSFAPRHLAPKGQLWGKRCQANSNATKLMQL